MTPTGAAYDAVMSPIEALGLAAQRARLVAGATGRVLDVGAGTGLNLRHYPADVTVTACEPDPDLRARLERRASTAAAPITIVDAGVPGLPFEDESFDTVVCTLVLCTVADVTGAIADLRRVITPTGTMLFFEHIVGRHPLMARLQHAASPAWSKVAGGCRLDRDTIASLRAGGFVIADCERMAPLGRFTAGTVVKGRAVPRRMQ